MSSDFPDGQRSNVPKSQQDLAMLVSHPHMLWGTVQVDSGTDETVKLYNQDLNHVYVVNALNIFCYATNHSAYFAYFNGIELCGGITQDLPYVSLDYSQNVNLLYGDYIQFDIHNYGTGNQWYFYCAIVTVYPRPSSLVRRPQALFTLADYSISKNTTISPTNVSRFDPEAYLWDWGDGSAPSTAQSPTHLYTVAGVYDVSLTVSTGDLSDTYITRLTVS